MAFPELLPEFGGGATPEALSYADQVRARVAKLAAARGAAAAAPAAIPAAAAAPTMASRFATAAPTLASGLGAVGRAASAVLPFAAPAAVAAPSLYDAAQAASDTTLTGGERAAGATLNALKGTGAAAGAMLGAKVPGPWWLKAAGAAAGALAPSAVQAVSQWWRGAGATPPAASPVPAAAPTMTPDMAADGTIGGSFGPSVVAPQAAIGAAAPMTAAQIVNSNIVPPVGTGAILNNQTGAVTSLDTRAQPGVGAVPGRSTNFAGSFVNALIGMKQIAGDETRKTTLAKAAPGAMKDIAETAAWSERLRLAALETDPNKKAALLGARPGAQPHALQAPVANQPMTVDPKNPRATSFDPNTGVFTNVPVVTPPQNITFAQAVASAKKNGTYKTDAQVRADMAKLTGYRLVD